MSNFLLIGGGGFVGTNFNFFIKANDLGKIVNLDNGRLTTNKVNFTKFDVNTRSIEDLIPFLRDADIVINFAAITRVEESIKDPANSFQINVNIHLKICEALRVLKVKENKNITFLFISTGGAIAGETKKIIDETTLPRPISLYGASKLSCESLGYSYSKSFNLDIRNLRFTNIYGPHSDHKESVIARFIKLIIKKEKLEIRDQGLMKRDFIYVQDVCNAIYKMINKGKPGLTVQFGYGKSYSIIDIFKILDRLSPGAELYFAKSLEGEVSSVECNIKFAEKTLDWHPEHSLEHGINKTWDYFNKKL